MKAESGKKTKQNKKPKWRGTDELYRHLILSSPTKKMSLIAPCCQMLELWSVSRSFILLRRDKRTAYYCLSVGPAENRLCCGVSRPREHQLEVPLSLFGDDGFGPRGPTQCVRKTKATGSDEKYFQWDRVRASEPRKLMNCTINFFLICSPLAYFPWGM